MRKMKNKYIKWDEIKKIGLANWFFFSTGVFSGFVIMLIGTKYITHHLPDKQVVGTWLYLFHLMLGVIVILKGLDWMFDGLDYLEVKKKFSKKEELRKRMRGHAKYLAKLSK